MRRSISAAAAMAATAKAASLADICTVANVQAALPANGTLLGIDLIPSSVTASPVYNATSDGGMTGGSSTSITYCNVTLSYTHTGKDDKVVVKYAFPEPSAFKDRFYVAGGGGYTLNSDATGGISYGAASGATDAGYDAFSNSFDAIALVGEGSIDWDATHMFGYKALGEMTTIAKPLSQGIYSLADDTKIYTYYEGCSDGGREGMSQVQRWGDLYDGAITGAPAFRMSHQQVNHVFPALVEHTLDYYPPTCALAKIVNATIAACDPLDGRTDGVVSRTDLCKLQFNLSSIVGESYYCSASSGSSGPGGMKKRQGSSSSTPEQNGTVTTQDVAVAQAIYDGLHNSQGERGYLSWQIASDLSDGNPTYNSDTSAWELSIPSTGGGWVTEFIELESTDGLSDLTNVTYDTMVEWMRTGLIRYTDTLQTTLPDLTTFQSSGGKLLHYHGESDSSIPAASSVHYWQSVKSIMYPDLSDAEAEKAMAEWYQFYLIPGAGHCGSNQLQPGPYPEDNMQTIIDWVENGIQPSRLNATVSSGDYEGEVQRLCQWPSRPLWKEDSDDFDCVSDEESIESWTHDFNAFKLPVY
ncbi:Tannase/feruloyl esterase [Xylaria arbuscula]|nr:Tannase/feruloyl esterase [Xylaria arbuscula]